MSRHVLFLGSLLVLAGCVGPAAPGDSPAGSGPVGSPTSTATEPAEATPATPTPTAPATATGERPAGGTTTPTVVETPETPPPMGTTPTSPSSPRATFLVGGDQRASISLEVADTPAERREGLMGRQSLPRNHGMLFPFPDEAPRTFWMKNTHVPLDIIFVDANGTVLNVEHATPQPDATIAELRRYHSAGPAKFVVEVRRGFANRTGVGPGTDVRFSPNVSVFPQE